jgi:hypothetical protein
MCGMDSQMQYVLAILAQIFWPESIGTPRKVLQKFPLTPFQGSNNNCGVYALYYLAALFVKPTEFLNAFEPGKRLVVSRSFGVDQRKLFLAWTKVATNAYDFSLGDFEEEVKRIQSGLKV